MSPITDDRVLKLFKAVPFFSHIEDDKALRFLREKTEKIVLEANSMVFDEGDIGDYMYLILEGMVDVFFNDVQPGGRRLRVSLDTLKEGNYFGERSLLPEGSGKRGAGAKTLTKSTFLKIGKDDFLSALKKIEIAGSAGKNTRVNLDPEIDFQVIDVLRTHRFCKNMEMNEIIHYQGWADPVFFRSSEYLFKKGDPSDCLYLVINGMVGIYFAGYDRVVHNLAQYSMGGYFGEQSLLSHHHIGYGKKRRSASAKAEINSLLLRIGESQFKKILLQDEKLKEALLIVGAKQKYLRALRSRVGRVDTHNNGS